jgi:hypothetical protein
MAAMPSGLISGRCSGKAQPSRISLTMPIAFCIATLRLPPSSMSAESRKQYPALT